MATTVKSRKTKSKKTAAELNFEELISHGFHANLKENGFRKKKVNFVRRNGQISHVVHVPRNIRGTRTDIKYTVNFAIVSHLFWLSEFDVTGEGNLPVNFLEYDSIIKLNIGHFHGKEEMWLDLKGSHSSNKIIKEATVLLYDKIFPIFEQFQTDDDIIRELKEGNITGKPRQSYKIATLEAARGNIDLAKAELEYMNKAEDSYWLQKVKSKYNL